MPNLSCTRLVFSFHLTTTDDDDDDYLYHAYADDDIFNDDDDIFSGSSNKHGAGLLGALTLGGGGRGLISSKEQKSHQDAYVACFDLATGTACVRSRVDLDVSCV